MISSGEQYTFWELIKQYKIVVPKIQRDYVQGRKNATVAKNRKEFVEELVDAIKNDKSMSLNFVYGTIRGNDFIPIDGQQRLTTLFLLHLYVFAKTQKEERIKFLKEKFSYQTRYTTNRFIEKLAENLPAILKSLKKEENDLFDVIHKSGWYASSWDNDPNVVSCLVMLQLIHETWENKINTDELTEDWKITFMFLRLEEFGSDNRLYIRMNSRGKQLTDFENFKAELYEKVLKSEKGDNDKTNNFKKNIDGEWYSMLWDANIAESNVKDNKKIDIEKKARLIDSLLKRLFHWTVVSKACVKEEGTTFKKEIHDNLYHYCMPDENEKIDILRCGVEEYQSLVGDGIKTCIIEDLNSLLTFLTSLKDSKVFIYIVKDVLSISDNKGKNIYNIDSYSPRVLLYAITKFAKTYKKKTETAERVNDFQSWYRIVLNLVSTKEIGRPEDFQKAVRAIETWDNNTADWLREGKVRDAFRPAQVEEEILKLDLIEEGEKNNIDWKNVICNAENTDFDSDDGYKPRDYFRGQIGFLLHMAGVKEENLKNLKPNQLSDFVYYSKAVRKIFDETNYKMDKGNDEITGDPKNVDEIKSKKGGSFDNIFHRAMLIYGNYWVGAPGNNIKTFFVYNESHNNYDWRGAFREPFNKEGESCKGTWNVAVTCLQKLLDGFKSECQVDDFEFDQYREWLTNKVDNFDTQTLAMKNEKEEALRKLLIESPNCFKYIRNNYYVYWNNTIPEYSLMRLKLKRDGSFINITDQLTKQGQTP